MQPYFFPYLGYFELIRRSDAWVVFDEVKYQPKSWMSRNRVLHPSEGWQYVGVPVDKHAGDGLIRNVRLIDAAAAHQRICGQLQHYRQARAPYFRQVLALVDRSFEGLQADALCELNVRSLAAICDYLGLDFAPRVQSRLALRLPPIEHAGQWALEICSALGASSYVNPPGGRDIFRVSEWQARGIELGFTELLQFRYATGPYDFVEQLSVLDVLMWNAPATVRTCLDERAARPLLPA